MCRQEESSSPANPRAQGGVRQQHERGQQRVRITTPQPEEASSSNTLLAAASTQVLLQTAIVKVYRPGDSPSNYKKIRAILDTGSQKTYISQRVVQELKLPSKREDKINIKTFADSNGRNRCCQVVDIALQTRGRGELEMEALEIPLICDPLSQQPTKRVKSKHHHLRGLQLADYNDIEDKLPVDILIGSDFYWSMVTGNIKKGRSGPTAPRWGGCYLVPLESLRTQPLQT